MKEQLNNDRNDKKKKRTSDLEETNSVQSSGEDGTGRQDAVVAAGNDHLNQGCVNSYVSHFRNKEAHSFSLRYGLLAFQIVTIIVYLVANIGAGVSADYILTRDGVVVEQRPLFSVSIVSSVKKLWQNGSYPLAIFIALTSVSWPYVKIFLSLWSWMAPYRVPRKREFLVEITDALDKWSFVDIVVLVEIMVAFRSTIALAANVNLEITVVPKWGFYLYIVASIMSILSTHIILYHHRKFHYHMQPTNETRTNGSSAIDHEGQDTQKTVVEEPLAPQPRGLKQQAGLSNLFVGVAGCGVLLSIGFHLAGCLVNVFQIQNQRGDTVSDAYEYSVVSLGMAVPDSQFLMNENGDGDNLGLKVGIVFIQIMWFLLCVVMPLVTTGLFGILFLLPLSKKQVEWTFYFAEISFAWSCAEVLLISTVFSVLQMPTFGDGLIEADCTACFIINTELLLPGFAFLCVGTVLNVGVNVWLFRTAHAIVYGEK